MLILWWQVTYLLLKYIWQVGKEEISALQTFIFSTIKLQNHWQIWWDLDLCSHLVEQMKRLILFNVYLVNYS